MADLKITDALTGDIIEFDFSTQGAQVAPAPGASVAAKVTSLFFPGCSFINYAMPLVAATFDLLQKAGEVDGISVLCCGKILAYEPEGQLLRDAFEEDLRQHLADAGIERMVCACPNCVKALREALSLDPRTKDIKIEALPEVLATRGYRLDPQVCARTQTCSSAPMIRALIGNTASSPMGCARSCLRVFGSIPPMLASVPSAAGPCPGLPVSSSRQTNARS